MSKTEPIVYDFNVVDRKMFKLWKHAWFDIIHYDVSGLAVDFIPADIFVALLNHRIYEKEGYGSGSSEGTGDTHGPFVIKRLKPSNFVEISFDEWVGYIHARYADKEWFDAPPEPAQIEAVDDFINQLPKEEIRCFKLSVSHEDPDYQQELWFIHLFFDEYILLHPQQQAMWIIVLGCD